MTKLQDEINNWLNEQGYPLEMEAAEILDTAGYEVIPAEYYQDAESGVARETDVVGYLSDGTSNHQCFFAFVLECKSLKKPWLVFTRDKRDYPTSLSVERRCASKGSKTILRLLATDDHITKLRMFDIPERPAYAVRMAFDKGDKAYAALMSVSKAAQGIVDKVGSGGDCRIVTWPVVVIDTPLFEVHRNEAGETVISDIDRAFLLWRNPVVAVHSFIDIVTIGALPDFVDMKISGTRVFLDSMIASRKSELDARRDR